MFVPPAHVTFPGSHVPAHGSDVVGGSYDASAAAAVRIGLAALSLSDHKPGSFEVHVYDELGKQTGVQALRVAVKAPGSALRTYGTFLSMIDAMVATLRRIWPTAEVTPVTGFLPWNEDGIVRTDAMKTTAGAGVVLS